MTSPSQLSRIIEGLLYSWNNSGSYYGNVQSLIIVNVWYLRCEGFWVQVIERLNRISLDKFRQLNFINNDNPFLHISLFPLYDLLLLFCLLAIAHTFCASGTTTIGASSGSCTAHLASASCRSCWKRTHIMSVFVVWDCDCSARLSLACQRAAYVSRLFLVSLRLWRNWLNADSDSFVENMPPKSGNKRKENVSLVSYAADIFVLFSGRFEVLLVPFKVTDAVEMKIDLLHSRVLSYGMGCPVRL